jgi:hypothetical protein
MAQQLAGFHVADLHVLDVFLDDILEELCFAHCQ